MATQFACRTPGCTGVVRGSTAAASATCPECGRTYHRSKKPTSGANSVESEDSDEPLALPPTFARKKAEEPAKRARQRKRVSDGDGFWETNAPFILWRVLPVMILLTVFFSTGISLTRSRWKAKESAKLAEQLWNEVRGSAKEQNAEPYVRGELAVLETQSEVELMMQNGNLPQQWINNSIAPPLDRPDEIGSVIVVEWKVFADTVRDRSGRELSVQGADGPAMLKRWRCKVKLVDRQRHVVVYESALEPPDKNFESGDRVITTPSTRVTAEQLAAEFEKIRRFPRIDLNGDPPGTAPSPAPTAKDKPATTVRESPQADD